jgi:ketosteroid isomerase-like protein
MQVTRTADRVSISELLGEYVDAVNQKDYERLRPLFTPDALVDVAPVAAYRGVDAIVTGLGEQIEVWPGLIQVVHSGTVHFAADDGSVASGRWYISEFGVMADGTEVYFSGTYHDEYTRDAEGEWRFSERRYRGRFARRGTDVGIRPFPTDLPEPRA